MSLKENFELYNEKLLDGKFEMELASPLSPEYTKKLDYIEDIKHIINTRQAHSFDARDLADTVQIEGNRLSITDISYLMGHDISVRGKSLGEHAQTEGSRKTFKEVKHDIYTDQFQMTAQSICAIHAMVTDTELKEPKSLTFRGDFVAIKTTPRIPPHHSVVADAISDIIQWYYCPRGTYYTPLERIAIFKRNFELIHPFFDGNGRTGRVLMNLLLLQNGYLNIKIPLGDRGRYFDSLEDNTFLQFLIDCEYKAIGRYVFRKGDVSDGEL